MKPVLFVTGHAPPDRLPAFARLHEREEVRFALFGGRSAHGPAADSSGGESAALPIVRVTQRQVGAMAASGRFRAVVCGTGGRVALPAAYAGARAARVPFVLWASLWAHPRTAAHTASYLPLGHLYRSADAVVTYGSHVSAYVRARGARRVFVAPQAVDNAFWGGPCEPSKWPIEGITKFLFAGRPAREKGLRVLFLAWRASGLMAPAAALVLAGVGLTPPWVPAGGAVANDDPDAPRPRAAPGSTSDRSRAGSCALGVLSPPQLRNLYAAADVLIMPSISTRTFREPWGLVANEAMNQRTAIIASDAVGAVAGGLVRHERNGLVVPAGDSDALAAAIRRLADDVPLRARLAEAGHRDVQPYTPHAWAAGMSAALASAGASRSEPESDGERERW